MCTRPQKRYLVRNHQQSNHDVCDYITLSIFGIPVALYYYSCQGWKEEVANFFLSLSLSLSLSL